MHHTDVERFIHSVCTGRRFTARLARRLRVRRIIPRFAYPFLALAWTMSLGRHYLGWHDQQEMLLLAVLICLLLAERLADRFPRL